jgi:hypothetical protein
MAVFVSETTALRTAPTDRCTSQHVEARDAIAPEFEQAADPAGGEP